MGRKVFIAFSFLMQVLSFSERAQAYSANKVWFEFRPNGRYRVVVNYTIPALKEFRESMVEFTSKKEAERFYWALVRGADFYPPAAEKFRFTEVPAKPDPW